MTEPVRRVAVVGFGAAGLAVCQELRARGWPGELTLLSDEVSPPYDRPPLSKGFLTGPLDGGPVWLAAPDTLATLDLDLRTGVRAASVDSTRQVLTDSTGDEHPYDALVVATGVRPRSLLPRPAPGVHVLRTLADAERLRTDLRAGRSLVVVGGGFIGFEVAASARTLGLETTIVEPLTEPLRDRLGSHIAARLVDLHRKHGVRVLSGTGIAKVSGASADHGPEVQLDDGFVLRADTVLVSIGAAPDTAWLDGSGLSLGNGIVCDEQCRAGPGIWAAGDVAQWYHAGLGAHLRIEHRMNATEQGRAVAGSILGDDRPFVPVPFVWTDQYDVRVQVAGHLPARLAPAFVHGDAAADSFAVEWRDGRLAGVAGWNAARPIMPARRELAATLSTTATEVTR